MKRTLAVALVTVGIAAASARANPYPLDLSTAARLAYGTQFGSITRTCEVFVSSRDLEALAVVRLSTGRQDVAAFQFIDTAGWMNTWRLHAAAPGLDPGMRTGLSRRVRHLAAACSARWKP
jgi:hypothetical protein